MSRSFRLRPAPAVRALLLAGVASLVGCGERPARAPGRAEPDVTAAEPTSEPAVELAALPRLERLRLQVRTCVIVGGPGAGARLRALCQEILDQCDPDDLEARRVLGYTDFQADILGRILEGGEDPIPEGVANRRGYPFLDAVVEFHHKRWLLDAEEIEQARLAVAGMREHARRLEEDHVYRLGDSIRANLAADTSLGAYCYQTRWAPPHLICYATSERLTDYDLLKIPDWRGRMAQRARRRTSRLELAPALERKARVFAQLNAEFLRRYGDPLGLKPLSAPYGGRPDYKGGVRSYSDGVPLVVWVFEDHRSYQDFHVRHRGGPRGAYEPGYFQPLDGRVYTYDSPPGRERERQIRAMLRLGTYQLLHEFSRQRNNWKKPAWGQTFFGAGMAGYLSGARIGEDLDLEFTGLNVDLLGEAQQVAAQLRRRGMEYAFIPLQELTGVSSYAQVTHQGGRLYTLATWHLLERFFQQSWMFVLFLQEYQDGRYREAFMQYLEAFMSRETQHGMARQVLRRCLGIEARDWPRLDREFQTFVLEDLLKREVR